VADWKSEKGNWETLPPELIIRLVGDALNIDDFTIHTLNTPYQGEFVYHIKTPDKKGPILRIHKDERLSRRNALLLELLEPHDVAPKPLGYGQTKGFHYCFETFLPGTLFPYEEKKEKEKILLPVAKTLKKFHKVTIRDLSGMDVSSWSEYFFEFVICLDRIEKYFPGKFTELVLFLKKHVMEPEVLHPVHGSLTWKHMLFDQGRIRFINFSQSLLGDGEFDLGALYYQNSFGNECLDHVVQQTGFDKKKILYYSLAYGARNIALAPGEEFLQDDAKRLAELLPEVKKSF